jgi:hypothetical protein
LFQVEWTAASEQSTKPEKDWDGEGFRMPPWHGLGRTDEGGVRKPPMYEPAMVGMDLTALFARCEHHNWSSLNLL